MSFAQTDDAGVVATNLLDLLRQQPKEIQQEARLFDVGVLPNGPLCENEQLYDIR